MPAQNGQFMEMVFNPPYGENKNERAATFPPGTLSYSVLQDPIEVNASFALRYEVYCLQRRLLNHEHYPQKLELDHFDDQAIHVGGIDEAGLMRGTIRLVRPSALGLPLFEHCAIYPEFEYLADIQAQQNSAEVSRLAILKSLRAFASISDQVGRSKVNLSNAFAEPHSETKSDIILGLYKTIYQASKREGITHWFAAMEQSLVRLMRRFHFAFTPIGPEVNYYGPVIPYVVSLSTIEEALFRRCPDTFVEFMRGLEPELVPVIQCNRDDHGSGDLQDGTK